MEKIEILSPAGDFEKLKIAFMYGADACYIGGHSYSLRANANNFSLEEVAKSVAYAHKLNKKIYVVCNIVFHNEDLEGVEKYLKELSDVGIDAIILSDLFLIEIIKKVAPKLKIYLSTQLSITNKESVNYYKSLGAARVVLARELTCQEIKTIKENTDVELEVFLHGAMCTCYSGRCVLSNYYTNRDSNRGGCAQVCRFCFDLDKKRKKEFSIATKDLNLAYYIKDLIELNIKSLKIEGRMRSSYYLATVNSCYRNLIDSYYNNSLTDEVMEKNLQLLKRVANRESSSQFFKGYVNYHDQYYNGRCEISNQDFLAKVISYDKKTKTALIEQRNYFKVGDVVNLFGPNNISIDFKIDKIENEAKEQIRIANHPQEILRINVPIEVMKDYMIRTKF